MSDGLFAPVNAPQVQQTPVGVQPGESALTFANVVLVFGPAGSTVGMFVYTAGTTPGPGNPPVISVTQAATDPFGNTVIPGVTVYGASGAYINITSTGGAGGNTAVLFKPPGVTHLTQNPQVWSIGQQVGLANEFEALIATSGKAGHDDAVMQFLSQAADGSGNAVLSAVLGGVVAYSTTKVLHTISVPVTATAGTPSAPTLITTDSWHPVTLDANWSTLAGQPVPSYRLGIENRVHLTGAAQFNVNIGNTNINGGVPLPAKYRPVSQIYIAGGPGAAGVSANTNGVLIASSGGLATVFVNFNGSYPLDL